MVGARKCMHCREWLKPAQEEKSEEKAEKKQNTLEDLFKKNHQISRIKEIGEGGMAKVFRGYQEKLGRFVAIKILLPVHQSNEEYIDRFHSEARRLAAMSHPNIIPVYDEGMINNVHFILMQYVHGQNLHQIIEAKGQLPITWTLRSVIQVAGALGYVHNQGLVHRDVKSHNIMFSKDRRIILMDFGIVHDITGEGKTKTGTVLGTPEYMSPEQARGEKVDHRSDIYSLGVVMYQCMTGRMPFQSDNVLSTIHQIINERPVNPRSLRKEMPWKIENIIFKCLAKDPGRRYQTTDELINALKTGEEERVVEELDVDMGPTPVPTPRPRQRSRKSARSTDSRIKKVLTAIVINVAVVLAIVVFYIVKQQKADYIDNMVGVAEKLLQEGKIFEAVNLADLVIQEKGYDVRFEGIREAAFTECKKNGDKAFAGGRFAEARQIYQDALTISESPEVTEQIVRCDNELNAQDEIQRKEAERQVWASIHRQKKQADAQKEIQRLNDLNACLPYFHPNAQEMVRQLCYEPDEVLVHDDFSSNANGWRLENVHGGHHVGIQNGRINVYGEDPNSSIWSQISCLHSACIIHYKFMFISETNTAGAGIAFRGDSKCKHYFILYRDNKIRYDFGCYNLNGSGSNWESIKSNRTSVNINFSKENLVDVVLVNTRAFFYVNGVFVTEVENLRNTEGEYLGFVVSRHGCKYIFDDLVVISLIQ
ncbi:protein kinase [bacterium]|nr:protein kinase [bacterium]